MSGKCGRCGEHDMDCVCKSLLGKCHRCKKEDVKQYGLTEAYSEHLVCRQCAMVYHRDHEKFIETFMNAYCN